MSDADKYLRELNAIAEKGSSKKFREQYGLFRRAEYEPVTKMARTYLEEPVKDDHGRLAIQALARDLMERGIHGTDPFNKDSRPSIYSALTAAKLYEKIGKGKKAIPKLLKAASKNPQDAKEAYRAIREFIERNAGKRQPSPSGIEGKTLAFIGSTIAGIVLSAFSLTATGNAIGNLTGTSQGLLGLILFVVGIAGLVFSRK
jgi:hypothetical protein